MLRLASASSSLSSNLFRQAEGEVEWMRMFLAAGFWRGGGEGDEGLSERAAGGGAEAVGLGFVGVHDDMLKQ